MNCRDSIQGKERVNTQLGLTTTKISYYSIALQVENNPPGQGSSCLLCSASCQWDHCRSSTQPFPDQLHSWSAATGERPKKKVFCESTTNREEWCRCKPTSCPGEKVLNPPPMSLPTPKIITCYTSTNALEENSGWASKCMKLFTATDTD